MRTVSKLAGPSGDVVGYLIKCPACSEAEKGYGHVFYKKMRNGSPGWSFDGDVERPTFSPSMLVRVESYRCHSFVRNGRIEYLSDCTHDMAGQTVDLPPCDEEFA